MPHWVVSHEATPFELGPAQTWQFTPQAEVSFGLQMPPQLWPVMHWPPHAVPVATHAPLHSV